jgi:predicted ATPase/DNA-binding CsgD family transcriptional regulator
MSDRARLPQPLAEFIGRTHEMDEVGARLRAARIVTLTGAGGAGKTRLALEVARRAAPEYEAGACLVELAGLADGALLPDRIAASLTVSLDPSRPAGDALADRIGCRRLLLLLDNCEHLLPACAALASELLHACPHLSVLATSREALGVPGESVYHVPPLRLPQAGLALTHEAAMEFEALALFARRAALARREFQPTDENVHEIADICRHLDGMPLAIELAAARVTTLAPRQMLARLGRDLNLLGRGARNTPERQQTLRATIAWSYDRLDADERTLFERLSVFSGGFALEAAIVVAGDAGATTLDRLDRLVKKSLVVAEDRPAGKRFRLLETLRQYAEERLAATGAREEMAGRHARYALRFAREAEPNLNGKHQAEWLARLEEEHDNLRAALAWLGANDTGLAIELAGTLWQFWYLRGHLREGRRWIEASLQCPTPPQTAALAKALAGVGTLAWRQGDYASAAEFCRKGQELYELLGDVPGRAFVANQLAVIARDQGDHAGAAAEQERSLTLYRTLGNSWGTALALNNLGLLAQARADLDSAMRWHEEGLQLYVELGDEWGTALSLTNLGAVAEARRDFYQARSRYRQGLVLQASLGHKQGIAQALTRLGGVAVAVGEADRAARLLAAGDALRRAFGVAVPPSEQSEYQAYRSRLQATLPATEFDQCWSEGARLTQAQAIAWALGDSPATTAAVATPAETPDGALVAPAGGAATPAFPKAEIDVALTLREAEVLRLLAGGLSNRRIAEALSLSVHTVERHIATVYRKTGVHGKAAAASWAIRNGFSPFQKRG